MSGHARARDGAAVVRGRCKGLDLVLVKPTTYMNLSGIAVRKVLAREHAPLADLLVVVDDFDLPLGRLRLREEGSAGGHNGLRSIIAEMNTQRFARLRVGIGEPTRSAVDHVLRSFSPEEKRVLDEAIDAAATAVLDWAREGPVRAASRWNAWRPEHERSAPPADGRGPTAAPARRKPSASAVIEDGPAEPAPDGADREAPAPRPRRVRIRGRIGHRAHPHRLAPAPARPSRRACGRRFVSPAARRARRTSTAEPAARHAGAPPHPRPVRAHRAPRGHGHAPGAGLPLPPGGRRPYGPGPAPRHVRPDAPRRQVVSRRRARRGRRPAPGLDRAGRGDRRSRGGGADRLARRARRQRARRSSRSSRGPRWPTSAPSSSATRAPPAWRRSPRGADRARRARARGQRPGAVPAHARARRAAARARSRSSPRQRVGQERVLARADRAWATRPCPRSAGRGEFAPPRRHRRRLPGGPAAAGAHRVVRRRDRVAARLRPGRPAWRRPGRRGDPAAGERVPAAAADGGARAARAPRHARPTGCRRRWRPTSTRLEQGQLGDAAEVWAGVSRRRPRSTTSADEIWLLDEPGRRRGRRRLPVDAGRRAARRARARRPSCPRLAHRRTPSRATGSSASIAAAHPRADLGERDRRRAPGRQSLRLARAGPAARAYRLDLAATVSALAARGRAGRARHRPVGAPVGDPRATPTSSRAPVCARSATRRRRAASRSIERSLNCGFAGGPDGVVLVTDRELFGTVRVRRPRALRRVVPKDVLERLQPGELVVHIDHGIARYAGIVRRTAGGEGSEERDFLELHFAEGATGSGCRSSRSTACRATPAARTRTCRAWAAASGSAPSARVRKAVADLAKELLELYSARETADGRPLRRRHAVAAGDGGRLPLRGDGRPAARRRGGQGRPRARTPMDRLVVGDVGYGKTEVALRAAFKAIAAMACRSPSSCRRPCSRAAPRDLPPALRGLSRSRSGCCRRFVDPQQQKDIVDGPRGRRRRPRHRHAPAAVQGHPLRATWASSSSTRSSASAWPTRSASSSCARRSTC